MASKSKFKDKQSKSPPAIQVDTSVDVRDIIPGKLTDKEWNDLIDIDEGVGIVCEIVEEVVEKASKIIYERYLDGELFSYAVQRAKESILKIIGLQFIARDEGEKNVTTDPSWLPSQVPVPAPIHPRARGMIPMATRESLTSLAEAMDPIEIQRSCQEEEVDVSSSRHLTEETNPNSSYRTSPCTSQASSTKRRPRKSVKSWGRPAAKRSEAKLVALKDHPPSWNEEKEVQSGKDLDEHSLRINSTPLITKNGPNPTPFGMKPVQLTWMKEVKYDRKGKIIDMIKLDPAKFPTHIVQPHISIYRPPKFHQKHGLSKRTTKLEPIPSPRDKLLYGAAKRKSPLKSKHLQLHQYSHSAAAATTISAAAGGISSSMLDSNESGSSYSDVRGCKVKSTAVMPSASGLTTKISGMRFPEMPTMPSLVDTIDPLPGVTVREGGRSVQGPTPHYEHPTSPRGHLRPVKPPRDKEAGLAIGTGPRREAGKGVKTDVIRSKFTSPVTAS